MLRNATWTLSNLCRGKAPPPNFHVVKQSLSVLAALIYCPDEEVLTDACWALSYLSDGDNDKIQAVIEAGVCRRLVELLNHHNPGVVTPALRTIGNIVTGNDIQTQVVLNCNILPCLLHLLQHEKETIRKETCWTISNITAGNREQIQSVIDFSLIAPVVHLLRTAEFKTRKEAAWAISNATSGGNDEQIYHIVSQDAIEPLCDILEVPDVKVTEVALDALENILRVGQLHADHNGLADNLCAERIESCGGLDKIEALQQHPAEKIYDKVHEILLKFFNDEDEAAAASTDGLVDGSFAFTPGLGSNGKINF
jgi:hypothetical protein